MSRVLEAHTTPPPSGPDATGEEHRNRPPRRSEGNPGERECFPPQRIPHPTPGNWQEQTPHPHPHKEHTHKGSNRGEQATPEKQPPQGKEAPKQKTPRKKGKSKGQAKEIPREAPGKPQGSPREPQGTPEGPQAADPPMHKGSANPMALATQVHLADLALKAQPGRGCPLLSSSPLTTGRPRVTQC